MRTISTLIGWLIASLTWAQLVSEEIVLPLQSVDSLHQYITRTFPNIEPNYATLRSYGSDENPIAYLDSYLSINDGEIENLDSFMCTKVARDWECIVTRKRMIVIDGDTLQLRGALDPKLASKAIRFIRHVAANRLDRRDLVDDEDRLLMPNDVNDFRSIEQDATGAILVDVVADPGLSHRISIAEVRCGLPDCSFTIVSNSVYARL
jgi:hypothetical protein